MSDLEIDYLPPLPDDIVLRATRIVSGNAPDDAAEMLQMLGLIDYDLPGSAANGRNHGLQKYKKERCRCAECRAANTAENVRLRLARIARLDADPSLAEHGERNTFKSWHCRCAPCTAAEAAYRLTMPRATGFATA